MFFHPRPTVYTSPQYRSYGYFVSHTRKHRNWRGHNGGSVGHFLQRQAPKLPRTATESCPRSFTEFGHRAFSPPTDPRLPCTRLSRGSAMVYFPSFLIRQAPKRPRTVTESFSRSFGEFGHWPFFPPIDAPATVHAARPARRDFYGASARAISHLFFI